MSDSTKKALIINSDMSLLDILHDNFNFDLEANGYCEEEAHNVSIAYFEILKNAMMWGGTELGQTVDIEYEITPKHVSATITDHGKGRFLLENCLKRYDSMTPEQIIDFITKNKHERQNDHAGAGLYIVSRMVDLLEASEIKDGSGAKAGTSIHFVYRRK
jgi:anti-sigma regulatory factor (Ser/Thr protein kinase)